MPHTIQKLENKRKLTRYLHVLGTAEACKDIGRLTERGELGARKNVLTLSPDSQDQAVSLPSALIHTSTAVKLLQYNCMRRTVG